MFLYNERRAFYSREQCTKKIDSQLSERYDGARFRIKAVAGWASPPNLLEMFPSLGKATADALQSALNKQKTTLFLQQTRHDIDFAQDGSLKLTINYQAALTGILTAQSANIFAPRTIATAELESRREVISELEEQAQKSGSTSKDKKALKKALEDYKANKKYLQEIYDKLNQDGIKFTSDLDAVEKYFAKYPKTIQGHHQETQEVYDPNVVPSDFESESFIIEDDIQDKSLYY